MKARVSGESSDAHRGRAARLSRAAASGAARAVTCPHPRWPPPDDV
jgi:hypothetical protein